MNGTCTCKRSRELVGDTYANLSLFKREAGSAVGERSGDSLPINYLCRTQENLLVCCEDCLPGILLPRGILLFHMHWLDGVDV